jgi:hypothetical protein
LVPALDAEARIGVRGGVGERRPWKHGPRRCSCVRRRRLLAAHVIGGGAPEIPSIITWSGHSKQTKTHNSSVADKCFIPSDAVLQAKTAGSSTRRIVSQLSKPH